MLRSSITGRNSLIFFNAPTEQPGAPAPAAEEPAPGATIGEQLRAAISSKVGLQRTIDTLKTEATQAGETITRVTTDLTNMTVDRDRLQGELGTMTTDRDRLQGEVTRLEGEAKTAEDLAADIVAKGGFPAADLPAPASVEKIAKGEQSPRSTWGAQFEAR